MELFKGLQTAARRIAARPLQSAAIIAVLALGLGANTAVFSIVDSILLRPAPFAHADRLVDVLDTNRRTRGGGNSLSPQKIVGWQAEPSVFEAFEAYTPRQLDISGGTEPERVRGVAVSLGLFRMIGVEPQLGRGFAPGDGQPGSAKVVIIADGLWQRRFGGSPEALGARLLLNDEPYTIVGVMPRRFRLLGDQEALWLPVDLPAWSTDRTMNRFYGLGRLPAGLSVGAAQQRADSVADRLQREAPLARTWDLMLKQKRVASVDDATKTTLFVLLAAVGFVLLITCANVANLFLAGTLSRQREIAIRAALGAGRARLIREVLAESLLLAAAGGALGASLANWSMDTLLASAPENLAFMNTTPVAVDGRVIAVVMGMTLLTGLAFGTVPALRGSRADLESTLRGAGAVRGSTGRVPGLLVVVEVALSIVLLVSATLMIRTLARLEAVNPGFTPDGLVSMYVDLPTDRYPADADRRRFFKQVEERLIATPGISAVAVSQGVPPGLGGFSEGQPETEAGSTPHGGSIIIPFNTVTAGYFQTLGMSVIAGRTFTDEDNEDAIIVSRGLAERLFPNGGALGRRFRLGADGAWRTIVGIVNNVETREPGERRTPLQMYHPFAIRRDAPAAVPRRPGNRTYAYRLLIVRAADPSAAIPTIKSQIWSVDPSQPIHRVALVSTVYEGGFSRQRFVLLLMSAFAAMAVLLTAAGIFAVLSQAVAQRTREIGIRAALGARPRHVLGLIVGRGMLLTLAGVVIGAGAAAALTRFLSGLLYEVSPHDALSFGAVIGGLALVALMACWLPARRALRIDPITALRTE